MRLGGLNWEGEHEPICIPEPPANHPWHALKAKERRFGKAFDKVRGTVDFTDEHKEKVNKAFAKLYKASKLADQAWAEWKFEFMSKVNAIYHTLGEEDFWIRIAPVNDGSEFMRTFIEEQFLLLVKKKEN